MSPGKSAALERLATTCIFPGFEGPTVPDWVLRRLDEGLGGIVLFGWNVESAEQLAELTTQLRAVKDDVLIAIDEEGGDVTRLEVASGSSYPGNAALGAVDDVELTEQVAAAIAGDLRAVGVNLDLAPVADANTNPDNPVIGIRSFGPDGELVARHVAAFVRGLQGAGVAACAKHFPGHGDTAQDSHLELPVVDAIDGAALAPFRAAVDSGVQAIMTAHIVVRSLGGDTPATMSQAILRDLLRGELDFDGLVISDALEMKAISATVGVEEGAVRSLAAGADALCLGHDLFDEAVVSVRDALVSAVRSGSLAEERLAEAAGRVRRTAEWAASAPVVVRTNREIGLAAARRAIEMDGSGSLDERPLVVELDPEPSMAAGPMPEGPGDWLAASMPEAEVVRLEDADVERALARRDGRRLVVIARDAHRHAWQREAIEPLVRRVGDAIVVEVGIPRWRPTDAHTYVATHGAGRVNLEAAAERLYSGSRRGVEQSGSSPGS